LEYGPVCGFFTEREQILKKIKKTLFPKSYWKDLVVFWAFDEKFYMKLTGNHQNSETEFVSRRIQANNYNFGSPRVYKNAKKIQSTVFSSRTLNVIFQQPISMLSSALKQVSEEFDFPRILDYES
jgi:hypothetical protein